MRPRLPECVPDDVKRDGVIWRTWEQVRDEVAKRKRPLHPEVVKKMWAKWRKIKDELDREWVTEQNSRVAEIAKEIDRDKLRQRIDDEEEKRRAYLAADAAENAKWVAMVTEAQHRANKTEEKRLRRDIERSNQIIKQGLKRKFGRGAPVIPRW